MNFKKDKGLLPAGLSDVLAPDAAFEAAILERLLKDFALHGYDRVAPPLIEFEDSLLNGIGAGVAEQTFRLMDPESQEMMGVRADMTPQVARIATRRLSEAPRPLRLSYAGQVLRVRGSQLRPERQFTQVGAELIGPEVAAADAEVIVLAARALSELGIDNLSIDLGLPKLVGEVLGKNEGNSESRWRLRQALDSKDAGAVAMLNDCLSQDVIQTLTSMLSATGPAKKVLKKLAAISFTGKAKTGCNLLADVISRVERELPDLALTIDPIENRGFEYHTGVTFTFFAKGVRGELGNGGRYKVNSCSNYNNEEAATGFTLFMDTVLRALPFPPLRRRIYIPTETPIDVTAKLRAKDWTTLAALSSIEDTFAEAKKLGCDAVLQDNKIIKISKINQSKD